MNPKFCKEFLELFAEEMLKCVLRESNIPWDPKWGYQKEASEMLPDLNICRGLITESVSVASRTFRQLVNEEGSYVLDGITNSSDTGLLLPCLMTVADRLGSMHDSFFIFMAIANDLCIRFYRSEQQHLIPHVLETLVHTMKDFSVHSPELLRVKALEFLEALK